MKSFLSLTCLLIFFFTVSAQKDEKTIKKILDRQTECWNSGDLECFMEGYWRSENLVFIGSSGPKYGWRTTLNNYRKSYPDKATMGLLTFDLLSFDRISKDAYFVIGKWSLVREKGDISGHFTLLWRKIDGDWVIVADHSS